MNARATNMKYMENIVTVIVVVAYNHIRFMFINVLCKFQIYENYYIKNNAASLLFQLIKILFLFIFV